MGELREDILQIIIDKVVAIFKVDPDTLSLDTTFEELGCKSGNIVQIISALEDEFDAEIPFMQFNKRKTFGEAVDYVCEIVE